MQLAALRRCMPLCLSALALAVAGCKADVKNSKLQPAEKAPLSSTLEDTSEFSIYDLKVSGTPHRLCAQKLTSDKFLSKLTPDEGYFYDYEFVPAKDAFFFPDTDIKKTDRVKTVQNIFNYTTVGNIVHHSEQLYRRKILDLYLADEQEKLDNEEKRRIIAEDMPKISDKFLAKAFTDTHIYSKACDLLSAYRKYDGNEDDSSSFWRVESSFCDYFAELPNITDRSKTDSLAFSKWYDKTAVLPQYSQLHAIEAYSLTEDEVAYLMNAVECEENIDRRTLLAMELLRHNSETGIILLGDILESGLYTKYLYEAWDMWVPAVQIYYCGASSMSVIPNNYYRQIAAICVNTVLRHIQNHPGSVNEFDLDHAECLALNTNLDRFGGYYGNEAIARNFD